MKKYISSLLLVMFLVFPSVVSASTSVAVPINMTTHPIVIIKVPVVAGDVVTLDFNTATQYGNGKLGVNGIYTEIAGKPAYARVLRDVVILEDADSITINKYNPPTQYTLYDVLLNGVSLVIDGQLDLEPPPTPEPTDPPEPTPTPEPTPEPTPTPPPPLTVGYQPNKTAIGVNIAGGQAPYTVSWSHDGEQLGSITTSNSSYRIEGLLSNTNYVILVIDANSDVVVDVVNTGNFEGFIPPSFPSPGELFQKMIDNFGVAGSIAIAVISAAVALGLIVILGLWGWRLAKKWLNAAK